MRPFLVAVSLLLLAGACQNATEPKVCLASVGPAMVVTVIDSVTGAPIAEIASGTVQSDPIPIYVDTLRVAVWNAQGTPIALAAADARPGIYTIRLQAPGYRDMVLSGVHADANYCTVVTTARVLARLQPAS